MKEIKLTPPLETNEAIETVYLGGGTPSLLEEPELDSLFSALQSGYTIAPGAEITLEANPDDVSPSRLHTWKRAGINRLSIGVQSFFEEDLTWMNRAHTAKQALDCIPMAQDAGFNNISIDLIYGTPTLPDERWQWNVEKVIDLGVPHISCYALTVEPKTALQQFINKHKMQDIDPEQQARQFLQLIDWLNNAGYEHYEISNFSLPGKRSQHNTSYWQGKSYYGFGPSAHSFNGTNTRSWNIANNALYIKSVSEGIVPAEKEILTATQQLNEYIMTSLRTMEGININTIEKKYGRIKSEQLLKTAGPFLTDRVVIEDGHLKLTNQGKLFADGLAATLFFD